MKSSSQSLPLIRFSTMLLPIVAIGTAETDSPILKFHIAVQKLVDEFFNTTVGISDQEENVSKFLLPGPDPQEVAHPGSVMVALPLGGYVAQPPQPTIVSSTAAGCGTIAPIPKKAPSTVTIVPAPKRVPPTEMSTPHKRRNTAKTSFVPTTILETSERWVYKAPETFNGKTLTKLDDISKPRKGGRPDECPICLDPMMPLQDPNGAWHPSCCLKACGHPFHVNCLLGSLATSKRCPVCRTLMGKPQGYSPSGSMTITRSNKLCDGLSSTISIRYNLDGGIQKPYHENPGVSYRGESRLAYLPDSPEGNNLLKRLIYAFRQGLTFQVGMSLTTSRQNCITWASIHHKTTTRGGPHGFPDPSYSHNCNEELDNLGVPQDPTNDDHWI